MAWQVYLDHMGATLYSVQQADSFRELLLHAPLGNPHSSSAMHEAVDGARALVLRHFNARLSDYVVVFTSGATAALK